ncbi:hypothetical protein [Amycolatopsis nigrescens]|uniref:hypothetical protein n=1 Tax=Amycolatopsis nigrescens TaxID=381445 RepID=UPI00146C611F|nr:hypothetical protein [Amycolatopsis nigrescens]
MGPVTYNLPQSTGGSGVSKGSGLDIKTFLAAALMSFSAGMLVLVGYILLGNFFGGFLGAVGAGFGIVWWRSVHDKTIFPRNLSGKAVAVLAVVSAVLLVLALLLT